MQAGHTASMFPTLRMAESYSDKMERLRSYAVEALRFYDASNVRIHFLGHSENVTYRLEIGGGALQQMGRLRDVPETFLLRLHTPIHRLRSDQWRTPDVIRSELMWLETLGKTTGMVVPQPVANRDGDYVTVLHTEDVPINCTILRWVEGDHLAMDPTPHQAGQLGNLMAHMHQQALNWEIPSNFIRPHYDPNTLDASLDSLQRLVRERIFTNREFEIFEEASLRIRDHVNRLGPASSVSGLIHGDFHETNYVFHRGEPRAIDFSCCGFGYFLFDIGYALRHFLPNIRHSFLESYHSVRDLTGVDQTDLEAFMIWGSIENFAFHAPLHRNREFLMRAAPYLANNHCRRFIKGQPFLMEV